MMTVKIDATLSMDKDGGVTITLSDESSEGGVSLSFNASVLGMLERLVKMRSMTRRLSPEKPGFLLMRRAALPDTRYQIQGSAQ